jgi:hypothetical protein
MTFKQPGATFISFKEIVVLSNVKVTINLTELTSGLVGHIFPV